MRSPNVDQCVRRQPSLAKLPDLSSKGFAVTALHTIFPAQHGAFPNFWPCSLDTFRKPCAVRVTRAARTASRALSVEQLLPSTASIALPSYHHIGPGDAGHHMTRSVAAGQAYTRVYRTCAVHTAPSVGQVLFYCR